MTPLAAEYAALAVLTFALLAIAVAVAYHDRRR